MIPGFTICIWRYILSFNFNKKKQIGVKEVVVGEKVLVEAVV